MGTVLVMQDGVEGGPVDRTGIEQVWRAGWHDGHWQSMV